MAGRAKKRARKTRGSSFGLRRSFLPKKSFFTTLFERGKNRGKKTYAFVQRKPLLSFFSMLGILLALIALSSFLSRPEPQKEAEKQLRTVRTYSIGEAPRMSFQAKIEKSGIVTISALTPGVVSYVSVVEGQEVGVGTNLVGIGSNYSGGNVASLSRQLASLQYDNAKTTADLQRETITKQRAIAEKTDENTDRLREITRQSIDETRNLITLNESNLASINSQLQNQVDEATRQALLGQRAQLEGALAQLRSGLRNTEYAVGGDNPQAQLSNLSRELTLKQLELQEKAFNLSIESASLQLKIAQVTESTFYPSAPFAGTIERVHVVPGEAVNPGTPLVTLHGDQTLKAVVLVPDTVARNVSKVENSEIIINGKKISILPSHVSKEATDGQLYSVIYQLPPEYQNDATNNSYITVDIPVGYPDTGSAVSYIPLDAVYQSQNNAYIYVLEGTTVRSREVKLGNVFGEFVEIEDGIRTGDKVILNRNVIAGDEVKTQ